MTRLYELLILMIKQYCSFIFCLFLILCSYFREIINNMDIKVDFVDMRDESKFKAGRSLIIVLKYRFKTVLFQIIYLFMHI